jgi:hypothetical protein
MAKTMTQTDSKPTHEQIAQRARAIFEKSGRIPGRDMENWLAAEAQLTADHKVQAGASPSSPPKLISQPANRPSAPTVNQRTPR